MRSRERCRRRPRPRTARPVTRRPERRRRSAPRRADRVSRLRSRSAGTGQAMSRRASSSHIGLMIMVSAITATTRRWASSPIRPLDTPVADSTKANSPTWASAKPASTAIRQEAPTARSARTLITLLTRNTKPISSSTMPRLVKTKPGRPGADRQEEHHHQQALDRVHGAHHDRPLGGVADVQAGEEGAEAGGQLERAADRGAEHAQRQRADRRQIRIAHPEAAKRQMDVLPAD